MTITAVERRAKARAEETPQQTEERLARKRSAEQRQQHRRRREAQADNETLAVASALYIITRPNQLSIIYNMLWLMVLCL